MATKDPKKFKNFLNFKQNPTLGTFQMLSDMERSLKRELEDMARQVFDKVIEEKISHAKKQAESEVEKAVKEAQKEIDTLVKRTPRVKEKISKELRKALEDHIGKDGLAQIRGEDGKTPVKGEDFFTQDELEEVIERAAERATERATERARPIKGVDFDDGKDADPRDVAAKLKRDPEFIENTRGIRGRPGKPGKNGSPDLPERVVEKINTVGRIKMSAIEGLEDFLNSLSQRVVSAGGRGGGGMGEPQHETFSGDGSTTEFTLSFPVAASGNAIWVYLNGQFLFKDTHYTVSGSTLDVSNLDTVPQSGETIDVTYIRGS